MTNRPRFLGPLLIALPLLSLALGAIAWLRYGIDIPWFDDWRGYAEGTIDSLAPGYLFRPINDTMSPVGLALDALAQRYLDGNSVAYQALSMVMVLGSLLILQWKLLSRALDNTLHAAICFSFTVLMLQPRSYWGLENLAYYQGLPLVFILGALWLMLEPGASRAWRGPAAAALGLLAGFTYISGAFGALAAGVALLVVAAMCYSGDARRRLLREATWFTAASALAAAAQFYFSVLRNTHRGIDVAFPTELRFWAFYLGKLARSLLLPPAWPWASLAITVLVCGIAAAVAFLLVRRAAGSDGGDQEKRVATICIPLAAAVFVYLMLVAAGRTNFRPPEMQRVIEVFVLGFTRFHFFWAAAVWPWVAAALIVLCLPTPRADPAQVAWGAPALALILGALFVGAGGFDHMKAQREIGAARQQMANCLLNELQRGVEVRCEGLVPPRGKESAPDAFPAYLYARKIGASFVRNFPLLSAAKRRETIAAFYRMDARTATPRTHQLEVLGNGLFRATGGDPQLYIQTNQPQDTRRCMTLDVDVDMKVSEPDTVQLFYAPAGDSEEYSENVSAAARVGMDGDSTRTRTFRMQSDSGFFESFRLDPGTRPQLLEIREIRVYCVWELR